MARNFEERLFTGRDLLILMDEAGIGVGATKHILESVEARIRRHPETYRALEGPKVEAELDSYRKPPEDCYTVCITRTHARYP